MRLETPASFSFLRTIYSHGWFDLPPFHWDEETDTLHRVITTAPGRHLAAEIREAPGGSLSMRLRVPEEAGGGRVRAADRRAALAQVAHMFRVDEPMGGFHALCRRTPGYAWVPRLKVGRLLRAPDPFEDLVKLLCTTNCAWSLTRVMVSGLVEGLGEPVTTAAAKARRRAGPQPAAAGRRRLRSFPTPERMAAAPPRFFRERVRAGYRAPHLKELARRVARGEIRPGSWLDPGRQTQEIRAEIESIKGAGRYVSENMLKLLGRYEGMGLDSWCRKRFSEIHARGRRVSDRVIERHYARFGRWRGLSLWCDLTRDWCEDPENPAVGRSRKQL